MKEFHLKISTPAGNAFDGEAVSLTVRGTEGSLGILAGHVPFVTVLKPAECHYILPDNTVRNFTCGSGLLLVEKDEVTVLSSEIKAGE
ncbi:MAG: F0F1 ATP synthase subunit epsilon [Clostridia bacterium]|nr:F0F1 ATP synthase subunit epsilon [Clostridia bacterium]